MIEVLLRSCERNSSKSSSKVHSSSFHPYKVVTATQVTQVRLNLESASNSVYKLKSLTYYRAHNNTFKLNTTNLHRNHLSNGVLKGVQNFHIIQSPKADIYEGKVDGKMERILEIGTKLKFDELVAEYDVHSKVCRVLKFSIFNPEFC